MLPQEGKHEKMSKPPLTRGAALTNHSSYWRVCCALIARRVCAHVRGVFVLLRAGWQVRPAQMAFHSQRALAVAPHFLSLLVKHVTAPASQHLCVCSGACVSLFVPRCKSLLDTCQIFVCSYVAPVLMWEHW